MKKFICFWGSGYYKAPITELHSIGFFHEDRGYGEDDIAKVKALGVAQATNLSDLSGTHIVTRVE